MTSPVAGAILGAFVLAFAGEAVTAVLRRRGIWRNRPFPTLVFALLLGTIGHQGYSSWAGSLREEVSLIGAALAALPLYWAGMRTDCGRSSSARHFGGVVAAGIVLSAAGFMVPWVKVPGFGALPLTWIGGTLMTVFWLFLVVSVIELCSLLPLLAGLVALAIGTAAFIPGVARETWPGLILAAVVIGAVLGRGIGGAFLNGGRSLEKSEILCLGHFCAVATLATFMKSVTLTGIVLPLLLLSILVIMISMRGFERGILLRAGPRE